MFPLQAALGIEGPISGLMQESGKGPAGNYWSRRAEMLRTNRGVLQRT